MEMKSENELTSEGTSFVFDKDIDEHSCTIEEKSAPFYHLKATPQNASAVSVGTS